MNAKVLNTLEYTKIINRLTEHATSDPGRKLCRDLVPMTSEGNNGAIRAWIENKDKGLSCIAPSNPTYTSAEALRVVIKALNGEDIPGNVVMDIETVTEENVDQYYRSDMPDSFWVLTELDDATLQKLYK